MPTYTFLRQDGIQIERLYKQSEVQNEIICDDGVKAVKIFKPCNFTYHVSNIKEQDMKKKKEENKQYMLQYGVEQFQPLQGQSQEQIRKDFEEVKHKTQQELEQKAIQRKKETKKKQMDKKKSFNEIARLYFKGKEQRKERQFNKNTLKV